MEVESVGLLMAFTAGLLSFLSPCVLPLVPSYVTFITGLSLDDVQQASARRTALLHGLVFTAGFSIVFVMLGALASTLGQTLFANKAWISQLGGVIILLFGLYLLGVLRLGFMAQDKRLHLADKPVGYMGTMVVGIAFGAGWTPCIGPILGSILTLASAQSSLQRGVVLLVMYSLGLAVPFILSAVAVDRFMAFFQRVKRQMIWFQRTAGAVMVAIAVLMITNRFTVLAAWLTKFTPEFLLERL